VLTKIGEAEGITVPDEDVEAEAVRGRERYGNDPKLVRYFDSERGRNFIKSTLRRSRVVEKLVDDWLAEHPDHPALPHAEAGTTSAVEASAATAAALDATDPDGELSRGIADDHDHDHHHHEHDHDHATSPAG
jgi:hypothetical protein